MQQSRCTPSLCDYVLSLYPKGAGEIRMLMNDPIKLKTYARTTDPLELPTLIDVQLTSFDAFINESLAELFDEISPIESFNGDLKLYFPCNRPEVEGPFSTLPRPPLHSSPGLCPPRR